MAKSDKIREVDRQSGEVKERARRFDERDWKWIAEFVIAEWDRRKRDRDDKERAWAEIDRQIAMEPDNAFKKLPDGSADWRKQWMAELELPLQAQALEVLVRDANQMLFPDSGPWFRAHSQVTDEYLRKVEGSGGIKVLGDENFIPSTVNQDNADKITEGFLNHLFNQNDLRSRIGVINAEAFKYGIGVGRARMERKNIWIHEARGTRTEKELTPVIIPCSIKNLYLEEPKPTLHSSTVLGQAHIALDWMRYENLAIAANKGSTDPDDEDGGWMPKQLSKIAPNKQGYVRVLEMEGDIVVPRKTVRSIVIPGAIITVAMGGTEGGAGSTHAVIRFRFRKYPFSSYILFPYLQESADDAYPSGPLLKGRPVQIAACDALNRGLDSAMLNNAPPTGWDRNDMALAQTGGPIIHPYAMWETADPQAIKVFNEIGGQPGPLFNAFLQIVQLYQQLTGTLPARFGAQTVSHTTAYAKNAELQRGQVRTVDYVHQTGTGPITRWLDMAYRMGRDALGSNETVSFWIDSYGGFVELNKSMLPEKAQFEWFGSGGPADKQTKMQNKVASLKMAVELDTLNIQTGRPPRVNISEAIDEVLREGGWTDLDAITNAAPSPSSQGPVGGPAAASGVPGAAEGNPGATVAALQNLPSAGTG